MVWKRELPGEHPVGCLVHRRLFLRPGPSSSSSPCGVRQSCYDAVTPRHSHCLVVPKVRLKETCEVKILFDSKDKWFSLTNGWPVLLKDTCLDLLLRACPSEIQIFIFIPTSCYRRIPGEIFYYNFISYLFFRISSKHGLKLEAYYTSNTNFISKVKLVF